MSKEKEWQYPKRKYLERWVQVGKIKTHYLTNGNGEPVLFLHGGGFGTSSEMAWHRNIDPIAEKGFAVYAMDQHPWGLTEKPEIRKGQIEYTFEFRRDQIARFLDTVCVEKVNLVGLSMGGLTSMSFAGTYPERINKLVLVGSPPGVPMPPESVSKQAKESVDFLRAFKNTPEYQKELMEKVFLYKMKTEPWMIEHRMHVGSLPRATEGQAEVNKFGSGDLSLNIQKIAKAKIPTLLVWGNPDAITPVDPNTKMLQKLIPQARLEVIEDCGHWVEIEAVDKFNKALVDFFSQ
ncbi:MAG: alpha/beta hydrolase [Candidatus Bathyarchaeota archaeon]